MMCPVGNTAGGLWIRRRIVIADTDLPEPDSPTMAIVSPSEMDQDTPSTALSTPRSVLKCRRRSLSSSSGADASRPMSSTRELSLSQLRVEGVAQPVGDEGERERGD